MYDEPDQNLYYALREEIIKNALSFSRKMTAFAMLEELSDVQAMFCYSQQELTNAKDERLILISHLIITKFREFLDDMSEYGVDEYALTSFFDLTERFQTAVDSKLATLQKVDSKHDVLTH